MEAFAEHPDCKYDKSGIIYENSATLPTRMLEISGSHERLLVKLVETKGHRAITVP